MASRRRTIPRLRSLVAIALALTIGDSLAEAQGAPSTDIHLLSLTSSGGRVTVGAPVNITARAGYDNQPSFTPDGASILYTSVRDDGQSDIYRYDISTRRTTRVTTTSESEYSATVMPGGSRMSVIRVEADSTQRLWSFSLDGSDPRLVLEKVKPVGYHAWADDSTLALFVLGSPATLQVANLRTGTARQVLGGIGRSINPIPRDAAISFVHKVGPTEWWIKRLDPRTDSVRTLVQTLRDSEDHAWMPDGSVLMARADSLFRWTPDASVAARRAGAGATVQGSTIAWELLATFADPGLRRISRLAVSPRGDYVALVSIEATPR